MESQLSKYDLAEIIKKKICNEGPVSFRDFMEMSLYYPDLGYYTSTKDKIGAKGDYYTSPVLTNIFGEMVAKQIEEMWHRLNEKEFTIVEYGAGTGALCCDILGQLKNNRQLYSNLKYCIIEKSDALRKQQQIVLPEKVSWHKNISDIDEVKGCVLSNEVVDNFAVHKVVMQDELMEVFIDHTNEFVEILKPASPELKNYIKEQNINLPFGHVTEINLQALDWITEIAQALKKGFVLTIDYGFRSSELYCGQRNKGTLMCYNKHKTNATPYNNIGEQDITAHVNFSALSYWGAKKGLEHAGYTNQALFLRSLGLVNHLRQIENKYKDNHAKLIEVHTLLNNMGNKFKVLIQQKGIKTHPLSGMQFSEPVL